jgi:Tfp pilus assembly protein PilV
MLEESNGNMTKIKTQFNKGFSTLEILLAFAILILAITAVIGIGFGNQSITVDAETNTEALNKAQSILEDARASTTMDYFSIVSKSFPTDSIYTKDLIVNDLTPCKKQATSTVSWDIGGRTQTIELGTFLTDVAGTLALGGDCDTEPSTSWDDPISYGFSDPIHNGSEAYDVDVIKRNEFRYALLATKAMNNKPTLWILDVTNPEITPPIIGSYTSDDDYIDLDSAGNFVYIATASSTAQLQIIDITNLSNPTFVKGIKLPGVAGSDPGGISIYYYEDKVYVGTKTDCGE